LIYQLLDLIKMIAIDEHNAQAIVQMIA